MPQFDTGFSTLGNNATLDARHAETSVKYTVSIRPHQGGRPSRSPHRASTSSVCGSTTGSRKSDQPARRRSASAADITGTPGYAGRRLERLRGVPARPAERLRQERAVRGDDDAREPVRPVRPDRWQVNDKLTVNLGLRYEIYPLMTRADRGIELLDSTRSTSCSAASAATRATSASRPASRCSRRASARPTVSNDNTVFRTGYGLTFNPMPWSRPLRGFYPATIAYSDAGVNGFVPFSPMHGRHSRRAEPGHPERQHACCRAASTCARRIRTTSKRGTI